MNVYAKELIQQEGESLDQPFLYLFSDADGDDLKRTIVEEGKMLSIADILNID